MQLSIYYSDIQTKKEPMHSMPPAIKKTLKGILWAMAVFVFLFVLLAGLIQLPSIQTQLIQYATGMLSSKTHSRVELENVSISFPKSVVLKGLYLEDLHKDSLLYVRKLEVDIRLYGLISKEIAINSLTLEGLSMDMHKGKKDSVFNYNFLLTAFSDSTKKAKTPSQWTFSLKQIILKDIRLRYYDALAGIDVAASLHKLKLQMDEIDFKNARFKISSLLVNKLNARVHISASAKLGNKESAGVLPIISAQKIELSDATVSYRNSSLPKAQKQSFDADNMQFRELNLAAKDFYYSSKKISLLLTELSAIDQHNFRLRSFETDFYMDAHTISAKKLKAKTTHSKIEGDLGIQFSSLQAISDSLPLLGLHAQLKNTRISTADLLYFSPQLRKQAYFKNRAGSTSISGQISGRINNLTGKKLQITAGSSTLLETDFRILGLPKVETTYFDIQHLKLISGKQDIKMMLASAIPDSINLPDHFELQMVFKGQLKAFKTALKLKSSYGEASVWAAIDKRENFSAKINCAHFELGKLLSKQQSLGTLSLKASLNGQGLRPETAEAAIKADVAQIYLNKYNYQNLKLDGKLSKQLFQGKLSMKDENLDFDFDGLVCLAKNKEQLQFRLQVGGARLQKLNLSKNDTRISFNASADFKGWKVSDLNGKAEITNMLIVHKGRNYVLDSMLVASINRVNRSEININTALIGIKYSGSLSPTSLPQALRGFLTDYFPFATAKAEQKNAKPSNFNFEIALHNQPVLTKVLLPELTEFEPGIIRGHFDSEKHELQLKANMKRIVYGSTQINNLNVELNADASALKYSIASSYISNAQVKLEQLLVEGKVANKQISANISLKDKKLWLQSIITKNENNYQLVFDPKQLYLMNSKWDIAEDNYIKMGKQGLLIHHLFLHNMASKSEINIASVNDKFNDDLNIALKNFKLEDISGIIEKDSSLLKGNVDGNILLKRVNKSYGIIADAKISQLFVRNIAIGDLSLTAKNPSTKRFDIEAKLSGAENNLSVAGYFIPKGEQNSWHLKADIESLSMKTLEAFSMGQITETAGALKGSFLIAGKSDAPEISGWLTFNNAFLKPSYLNNRLELMHETIQLKADGLHFKSFTLLDKEKNKAVIDGRINMQQFSNFVFDMQVRTKDFLLFNTTKKDNKEFFGRMIIDSRIDVKGPLALPIINAKVKLKKGSNFTFAVPEEKLSPDKGENIVAFDNSIKSNPILNSNEKAISPKSGIGGIDLSSVIEVDKEATLKLMLDPSSSDSLVVKGEAALSFAMDRSGKMSLTGAYNLNEGSYIVSLQQVIKRKFDINEGSTIIWNGDPLDATISINATYTVRAAPYDLVASQMAGLSDVEKGGYKQQYPFLVQLKLRGAILKPEISFEIQLKPEDKGILGGAVNQKLKLLNEDASLLNKQVFALLILGRFVQENPLQTESDIGNTLVGASVKNFLSTQLEKLSAKMLPGVAMNFELQSFDDYETGTAKQRTQVEIGVKKQLFKERLSVKIGGAVDVEGDKAKENSVSDIASDVIIEYKLTKDGRYLLKAFRHNQYEGAIDGLLVETGGGFVYVREFNKWKEFMRAPQKGKRKGKK